jgi:hypothetical protein
MVTRILRDDPGKSSMHNVRSHAFKRLTGRSLTKLLETSNYSTIVVGSTFRLRHVSFVELSSFSTSD